MVEVSLSFLKTLKLVGKISPFFIDEFSHDSVPQMKSGLLAVRLLANASWPRLWLSTYTLYIYINICYIIHSVHSKHCEAGPLETTIINSAIVAAGSHSV